MPRSTTTMIVDVANDDAYTHVDLLPAEVTYDSHSHGYSNYKGLEALKKYKLYKKDSLESGIKCFVYKNKYFNASGF